MAKDQAPISTKDRQVSKPNGGSTDSAPPPSPRSFSGFSDITNFLWSVADLLRGDYKQSDYGKVILPLTVLRRLDCVLEKTKAKVLAKHDELKKAKHPEGTIEKMLLRAAGTNFYNTSKLDFEKLKGDPNHIAANLTSYIKGFSEGARDIIEQFKFAAQIAKLDESNLLFQVVSRFADVDLHPDKVPNHIMGSIFEELIRKFAEASNETAGEHFTPREVIRLMVDLLFIEDEAPIPIPPAHEVEAILAWVHARLAGLDRLTQTISTHVEKLHEYRQALITGAVTGRIDVSKEAA
jgi:type I restriction enzyme M protein